MNAQKRRAARNGFTLVEILCVVVILAIAATIVVPQVASHDDLNASAGARELIGDLLYAQNRAIATQQMQYVSFNVAGQSYGVYTSMAAPLTPITNPITQAPYAVNLGPTGVQGLSECTLNSVSIAGQTTIAFDETGVPYAYNTNTGTATALVGTGTIVISSGGNSLTISVKQDTGDISCN